MESILGFLLINIYAFLLIVSTTIIFFSKQRLKQFEDETYKNFLVANILMSLSGLILGLAVSPNFNFNSFLVVLLNKIYLISLMAWISILTFYYVYVSLKEKIDTEKWKKRFNIITIISIFLIAMLPLNVEITTSGAVATGLSIMFTYTMFGLGFLIQIISVLSNYKNLKNKKYIPLYLLILLGAIVLISMMINPSLNYLINPVFIFIAFIMFHTIENPDAQMNAVLLRNRELLEETVNDKSNFLFKVSQEMKKPLQNIIRNTKTYNDEMTKEELENLIKQIESDANNAYFIINDISSISSVDVKKLKIQDNKYMTNKLFKEIEYNVKNQLSIENKENIEFNLKTYNSYPEYLYGDNIKLKQVLLSVLSNSIKYTKEGFIDVEIDTITRYDVCRLVFTIKDSGCGMSISKINELLSTNDDLEKEEFEKVDSLDLKIPVAIKILKLLGGSISIKSEEGKGTIIVIVIDQKIEDTKEEKLLENAKKNVQNKKRIFIADDTENLNKIDRLLSKYNVEVISSLIGRECIDKIESKDKFDLIILKDEMKPDNAYTILKELKENKKFKTPVVIMIDKDKEFIKEHFIKDGFSDCIINENIENEIKKIIDKYL